MEGSTRGDITILLEKWGAGQSGAIEELAPLVYEHLRSVALGYLNREGMALTLQATALVNELFLRLLQQKRTELHSRAHFFAFAARMMRRILVDAARSRATSKRLAEGTVPLSPELAWIDPRSPEMMDLSAALDELEVEDSNTARVVEFRIFLGCTGAETAELMGVSKATADREMRYAIAWLYDRLKGRTTVHGSKECGDVRPE